MIELFEKTMLTAVGAMTLTQKKAEEMLKELREKLNISEEEGKAFLDEKKPVLINWLTVYLSSLSLDDIRGDRNLRSIQSHVRDAFNEQLFPDSQAQIKQVLIKEFPVQ